MVLSAAAELREEARRYLQSAKEILSKSKPDELILAALQLRMCMECLAYEKLDYYGGEINSDIFDKWQPRLVIARLAEVDPLVQEPYRLMVVIQDDAGTPAPPERMKQVGTEVPISIKKKK